MQIITQLK